MDAANGAQRGDTGLLHSLEEGCLTYIRPSQRLIFESTKVDHHATQVNGNTTVTFCSSKCDLSKTAECNASTPKHKAKAAQEWLENNNVKVQE